MSFLKDCLIKTKLYLIMLIAITGSAIIGFFLLYMLINMHQEYAQAISDIRADITGISDFDTDTATIEAVLSNTSSAFDNILERQSVRLNSSIVLAFSIAGAVLLVFITVTMLVKKSFYAPINKLLSVAGSISAGALDVKANIESADEFGTLGKSFDAMVDAFRQQAQILTDISTGDYTGRIEVRSDADIVNSSINTILERNNKVMSHIMIAAQEVAVGSGQIAQGAQNLASGSTQQAASIQEFMSALEIFASETENNASVAQQALDITINGGKHMQEGLTSMTEMQKAMEEIKESSNSITQVIKVIDDIAFQTNILALNAAVEAARAGQYGKGFAVVADEVRNLAAKSAVAAKETTSLIEASLKRVHEGGRLVDQTGNALASSGKASEDTLNLIRKIADESHTQMESIHVLRNSIEQISQVVQNNSATSEQSAASSVQMSGQAATLKNMVSNFKLKDITAQATPISKYGESDRAAFAPLNETKAFEDELLSPLSAF